MKEDARGEARSARRNPNQPDQMDQTNQINHMNYINQEEARRGEMRPRTRVERSKES